MPAVVRVPDKIFTGDFSDVTTPSAGVTGYAFVWNHATQMAVWTLVEAAGAASAAVAAHVALGDPHTQYQLESGLGTAAFLNVGTGASQVVQLTAASKLPAVDGSLLTNLPAPVIGTTTQVITNQVGVLVGHSGFTYNGAGVATLSTGLVAPLIRPVSDSTTAVKITKADGTTAVVTVDTVANCLSINTNLTQNGAINLDGEKPWLRFLYSSTAYAYYGLASGSNVLINGSVTGDFCLRAENTKVIFSTDQGNTAHFVISGGKVGFGTTTPTALADLAASTTARSSLRIRDGTAPATPNDGDIWKATGFYYQSLDAGTNAKINQIIANYQSSGTPTAGFGTAFAAQLESSTTINRDAGRISWEWVTATDASRAVRGKLSAYYTTTERYPIQWEANSSVSMIGFLDTTPVAKPAAYTQTYATATRTLAAYTGDPESGAYTGIDNLQVGSVYATVADLNSLRTAYETLRVLVENTAQVLNSVIDDNQAYGLLA